MNLIFKNHKYLKILHDRIAEKPISLKGVLNTICIRFIVKNLMNDLLDTNNSEQRKNNNDIDETSVIKIKTQIR